MEKSNDMKHTEPDMPAFVGVSGLPRAGSTLLCQLLAMHPEVACDHRSSPLCNVLAAVRRGISDEEFLLSRLDDGFDATYAHVRNALRGFMRGWLNTGVADGSKVVVDKNRAWLHFIEMALQLAPEARVIVCLRELGQVYGSIESRHQKTILLDTTDHLANCDRFGRADKLFGKDQVIGAPLASIEAVQDFPESVRERIFFMRFEDLMRKPVEVMDMIYQWLGVSAYTIDPGHLKIAPETEGDSHYRMKYPHTQQSRITLPPPHAIPPRIQARIEETCAWYYRLYYPDMLS